MGRPLKKGIDNFLFPVSFFSDSKIKRLDRRFPESGIRVYLSVILDGFQNNGYFTVIDEDAVFNLSDSLKMDEKEFEKVLSFIIQKNILVRIKHPEHGDIVTSEFMQDAFQISVKGRANYRKSKNKQNWQQVVDPLIWRLDQQDTDDAICPGTIPGQSPDNPRTIPECSLDCPDKTRQDKIRKEKTDKQKEMVEQNKKS